MRKYARFSLVVVILVIFTSTVAALEDEGLGSFSRTGYSTNIKSPYPGFLLPSEIEVLPSGHTKFHISAQGGLDIRLPDPNYDCVDAYGAPCDNLCEFASEGETDECGIKFIDEYNKPSGSFMFEEWGVYYRPQDIVLDEPSGENHGELIIYQIDDETKMRFGAQAIVTHFDNSIPEVPIPIEDVYGNYRTIDDGEEGSYFGDAAYVFSVDHTPCYPGDENCLQCAAYGGELKLKNKKAEWWIENAGREDLIIDSISVNWPECNGELQKIRLGGKVIYNQAFDHQTCDPFNPNPLSFTCDPTVVGGTLTEFEKTPTIGVGKDAKLTLNFANKKINKDPWNYTILTQFNGGACATSFVDFQYYLKTLDNFFELFFAPVYTGVNE
ncbi:MAG: hypothetical protein GY759_12185 [Chloroflexi bacterium]|nr:hypothetical protein [Chloroflexota bacterium]